MFRWPGRPLASTASVHVLHPDCNQQRHTHQSNWMHNECSACSYQCACKCLGRAHGLMGRGRAGAPRNRIGVARVWGKHCTSTQARAALHRHKARRCLLLCQTLILKSFAQV